MGAWPRRSLPPPGRRRHRELVCASLSVGLAALQCESYRLNGRRGEDTTKGRTRHMVRRATRDWPLACDQKPSR